MCGACERRLLQQAMQAGELGPDGADGEGGAAMDGFMANIMRQFLAKDILYPTLKARIRSVVVWHERIVVYSTVILGC